MDYFWRNITCKIAKSSKTPLEISFNVNIPLPPVIKVPFKKLIGSLLYISMYSPDITYAVSFLRFLDTQELWLASKRVLS